MDLNLPRWLPLTVVKNAKSLAVREQYGPNCVYHFGSTNKQSFEVSAQGQAKQNVRKKITIFCIKPPFSYTKIKKITTTLSHSLPASDKGKEVSTTKGGAKQINGGEIDLLSFSLLTGAAVKQDLRKAPEMHICSEPVLFGRGVSPPTWAPLGPFRANAIHQLNTGTPGSSSAGVSVCGCVGETEKCVHTRE